LIEICETPLPLFGSDQRYQTRAAS
jgi:hypothetical protein